MQKEYNNEYLPLISVIIPVYKVEKYLERCVASVVGQTYKNLEIILVDDGSPDNSGAMCDEYAKKDDRIKVIHKKNGGLSDARNAGLEIMSGSYVGFVDSDDYIATEFFERLYSALKKNDADISMCGVIKIFDDGTSERENAFDEDTCFSGEKGFETYILDEKIPSYACTKLFKASVFDGMRFPVGVYYEDLALFYKIFDRVGRYVCVKDDLYYYCLRKDSICAVQTPKQTFGLFNAFSLRYEFVVKNGIKKEILDICLLKTSVFAVSLAESKGENDAEREYSLLARGFLKKHKKALKTNKLIPKKRKFKIFLINNCYWLFKLLKKKR